MAYPLFEQNILNNALYNKEGSTSIKGSGGEWLDKDENQGGSLLS